jgi:hypothetical protein
MSEVHGLLERIEAEFSAWDSRRKELQASQLEQHREREQRAEQFERVIDELREIWRPRLEALAERFGERVQVKPSVSPGRREAVFKFQSPVARIALKFTASTNTDVTDVVLSYDLDILPILMQFNKHAELKFPLGAIDRAAVASWFDDRIVEFVKTYLSLHENEFYLKDQMVEDPAANVRFPKFAAGATLERGGKTLYFLSEETRQQFEQKSSS